MYIICFTNESLNMPTLLYLWINLGSPYLFTLVLIFCQNEPLLNLHYISSAGVCSFAVCYSLCFQIWSAVCPQITNLYYLYPYCTNSFYCLHPHHPYSTNYRTHLYWPTTLEHGCKPPWFLFSPPLISHTMFCMFPFSSCTTCCTCVRPDYTHVCRDLPG